MKLPVWQTTGFHHFSDHPYFDIAVGGHTHAVIAGGIGLGAGNDCAGIAIEGLHGDTARGCLGNGRGIVETGAVMRDLFKRHQSA